MSIEAANAYTILLVEDNPVNQKLAKTMLEHRGYRVALAGNGLEAVECIRKNQFISLILMDMQMPIMGGIEATLEIRKIEASRGGQTTPIIALTASAMDDDKDECFEAGMNDYVSKPISKAALLSAVERWLRAEETTA